MERILERTFWKLALLFVTLLAFPGISAGSGVYLPGNGSRSGGMADAVVATGADGDAVIHNPSNLAKLRGFGLRFDGQLSVQTASFLRAPEGDQKYDWVNKKVFPIFIPILSLWYNFQKVGPGSLTLSLFSYAPHGKTGYHYPEKQPERKDGKEPCQKAEKGEAIVCDPMPDPGPQRTVLIAITSPLVFSGLAAAYEWNINKDWALRFGGSFKIGYLGVYQRQTAVVAGIFYKPSSPKITPGEAIMEIDINGFSPTGDLALSLDMPAGFSFGTSFAFPVTFRASGTLTVTLNKTIAKFATIYGKNIDVITSFPAVLRFGFGWQGYGLRLELGFFMEFWSILKEFKIIPQDIEIEAGIGIKKRTKLPEFTFPQEMNDAFSIRFGAEYQPWKYLLLRTGVLYESNAVPLERLNVNSIDYPKIAITGGVSFLTPWGFQIDVSFMHSFQREFVVENSPIRPVDVSPKGLQYPKPLPSTSNGTYRYSATIVSFGIQGSWGK